MYFYPRPPRGGRPLALQQNLFLSTPSARRATSGAVTIAAVAGFLSTPSARRATLYNLDPRPGRMDFYPRPPRGGRRAVLPGAELPRRISIHALREEGDEGIPEKTLAWITFLSTPSARRATSKSGISAANVQISIHALREEGDLLDRWEEYSLETFLSTPSARRATRSLALAFRSPRNFYPRPPRGGRRGQRRPQRPPGKFLSTPSARRATIKFGRAAGHFKISIHALREEGDRRASAWPRS